MGKSVNDFQERMVQKPVCLLVCLSLPLLSSLFLIYVFLWVFFFFGYLNVSFLPVKFSLPNVMVSRGCYCKGAVPFISWFRFDSELQYLSCCADYEQFFERLSSRGWLSNSLKEGQQAFVSHVRFFLNQAITLSFSNPYLKVHLKESS